MKTGAKGEVKAEKWLKQNGFSNIQSQEVLETKLLANQEPYEYHVRPDFIADKKGEKWIIEVKTGKSADWAQASTRRQLLEYQSLCPEHHLALFDADHLQLTEIDFPQLSTQTDSQTGLGWLWFSIGFFIGLGLSFAGLKAINF